MSRKSEYIRCVGIEGVSGSGACVGCEWEWCVWGGSGVWEGCEWRVVSTVGRV